MEVDAVGAAFSDGEEEVGRPERRDEGVADAGASAVGHGIALGEAIPHAGGFRSREVFVHHRDVLGHGRRE